MGKKSENVNTSAGLSDALEDAIAHEVARAERRAWLAADELGTADEEQISSEVSGAVRLEAVRAAQRGADIAKVKVAAAGAYREGLEAALRERGYEPPAAVDISGESDTESDE